MILRIEIELDDAETSDEVEQHLKDAMDELTRYNEARGKPLLENYSWFAMKLVGSMV